MSDTPTNNPTTMKPDRPGYWWINHTVNRAPQWTPVMVERIPSFPDILVFRKFGWVGHMAVRDAESNDLEWGGPCKRKPSQAAAIAELNARLEERAQDHIKASARDVAEIQRLRVELDALKRRIVKPLVWGEERETGDMRWQYAFAGDVRYEANLHNGVCRLYVIDDWTDLGKATHQAESLDHAKRIAEDLHREAVLALMETEA